MNHRTNFLILLLFIAIQGIGQDLPYAKRLVEVLASDSMAGRGYQLQGDLKAATFLRDEFVKHGLRPVGDDFFHPVVFPVNSIVGSTYCAIDGLEIEPGKDYYISARSKGREATYQLVWLDHSVLKHKRRLMRFMRKDLSGSMLVIDPRVAEDTALRDFNRQLFWKNLFNAAGIIRLQPKPGWQISDANPPTHYVVLTLRSDCISRKNKQIALRFGSRFEEQYRSQNVIGMVPGTLHPDSFIVFTAHYDHLGMMGEVIIPGANDNASGTAMLTDLARHYAREPQPWSVAFMAFTAEEAGLIGSGHYAANPLFPLEQIRLLINLDMVGTGSEGITLVNGAAYEEDFRILDSINATSGLLPQVKARGESPNSDHHPFYAKGVRAFFVYTMGSEFREYHNIYDRAEQLPFTAYNEVFLLLTRFAGYYMR